MNRRLTAPLAVLMLAGIVSIPIAALPQGSIFERAQKKMEQAQKKLEQTMQGKPKQAPSGQPQPNATEKTSVPAGAPSPTAQAGGRSERIRISGQYIGPGEFVTVKVPEGLDSMKLQKDAVFSAFLPALTTSTTGPEAKIKVVALSTPATGGGYSDVTVSLESIDHDGTWLATPNTLTRIMSDALDRAEVEAQAAGETKQDTGRGSLATSREIEEIFGTGEKRPVRLPAMAVLSFKIGSTEFRPAGLPPIAVPRPSSGRKK